jgi:hypothetical protein
MGVMDGSTEEKVEDAGEQGVAYVAVQPGHSPRKDPSLEAIAHDEVVSAAQALEERKQSAEVVRVIRVAHDDEATLSGSDAGLEGAAVTAVLGVDYAGAVGACDVGRTIGTAVVGYDDLTPHPQLLEGPPRFVYAATDCVRFVEAGHDYRNLDVAVAEADGSHR